jgi:sulfatase-modifying factor enzyme 1
MLRATPALFALAVGAGCGGSCSRGTSGDAGAPPAGGEAGVVSTPSATSPGTPRQGMIWIPSGVLRAGTPPDRVPRVAEAELPGTDVALGGFYIDELAYPDESGAIPTTNVTRDDASRLCAAKGKRLCTELEWERACKGPQSTTYEYGDTYRPQVCGTDAPIEQTAKHPSGGNLPCKTGFGVRDMHGGVAEWTDSPWERGSTDASLAVVRGGAGEIGARCANAAAREAASKGPALGFRCCAGPKNDARVNLEVKRGPVFEHASGDAISLPVEALGGVTCGGHGDTACALARAWTWRPVPNVELAIRGGCVGLSASTRCGLAVAAPSARLLAQVDCGREVPEVVLVQGGEHRVRVRGWNERGPFFQELVYSYGRVEVKGVGP